MKFIFIILSLVSIENLYAQKNADNILLSRKTIVIKNSMDSFNFCVLIKIFNYSEKDYFYLKNSEQRLINNQLFSKPYNQTSSFLDTKNIDLSNTNIFDVSQNDSIITIKKYDSIYFWTEFKSRKTKAKKDITVSINEFIFSNKNIFKIWPPSTKYLDKYSAFVKRIEFRLYYDHKQNLRDEIKILSSPCF